MCGQVVVRQARLIHQIALRHVPSSSIELTLLNADCHSIQFVKGRLQSIHLLKADCNSIQFIEGINAIQFNS